MQPKVYKADKDGDGFYYLAADLQWAVEPTDQDPGVTEPKPGAIPHNKDGSKVFEQERREQAEPYRQEDWY